MKIEAKPVVMFLQGLFLIASFSVAFGMDALSEPVADLFATLAIVDLIAMVLVAIFWRD
jgi:hypothetical protein